MTESEQPAVRIRGLTKRYPPFVLGPLDLTVPAGSVYGLIGPNGAGKTTTLDLILGMGEQDAGTIEVLGLDHRRDEVEVKRRIGYVSPELSYLTWGRIGRVLAFLRPYYPSWDDAHCAALLKRFRLNESDKVGSLSLGNRTRLAVVAALAHRPELLILDEPTTGLDAVGKKQFYDEVLSLMQEEGRTVLISSHGLADLERYADHLGLIANGKMLMEGSTAELIERHRILDLHAGNGTRPAAGEGARVLSHSGDRWRVLVDTGSGAGRAAAEGAEVLSSSRVTLEDLFVALVEEETP